MKYQLRNAKIEIATKMTTASTTLHQPKAVLSGINTYEIECLRSNREVKRRHVDLESSSMLVYNHHSHADTYSKDESVESDCANIEWFRISA